MGNSPSSVKNESSQSLQSSSSSTATPSEVVEPDPGSSASHSKRLVASSLSSKKSLTTTNITGSTVTTATTTVSASTAKSPPASKDASSSDFDILIASSMAYALNINKSNTSNSSDDVASSSLGSDLSLLTGSSMSSVSSSTPNALPKNLEPIDEASLEGTPEPIKVRKKKAKTITPIGDEFDIDAIIESLIETGLSRSYSRKLPVTTSQIQYICARAREIFLSQPMLLQLAAPVKVVGDIHGQFYDLLRILKLCGFPPQSNYLFLGDYVDRGKQSLETLLLLLCFKVKYPENFFMLRGNHECASITKMYGFYDECKRRSSTKNWKCFVDVFNTLPVAATIGDKIFCVHGGLSPHMSNVNQIKKISRPTDVPDEGLLSDLLWSDPDALTTTWNDNDRGVSFTFGAEVVSKFLKKHNMDLIVRAHMVVEDGYEFFAKRKLVTVFSAPNYCGEFDNWGAVMNVNKNLVCSFEMLKPTEKSYGGGNNNSSNANNRKKMN